MPDLYLCKITIHYDSYSEANWLIHERSLKHPLVVLSDFEMKDLVAQYEKQKTIGQENKS
jgi:hypothetical protein